AKGFGNDGEALSDLIRASYIDQAKEVVRRGKAFQAYLNLALQAASGGGRGGRNIELAEMLVKAGAKEVTPVDQPRSPERLKLLTGAFKSQSGETVTIASG